MRNRWVSYIGLLMLTNATGYLRKNLGRPLTPRWRRALMVGFFALALFAAFQILAPFLISSALVRENMEKAVAQWTGHTVSIEGEPDLRFWPKPRITLKGITIRKQVDGGERVLGRIARLSASFDLLGAVTGQPEFKNFRMTDAKIFVIRASDGRLDWANDGLLSRAVRNATASASGQLLDEAADAPIGEIRIRNGSIEITSQSDGQKLVIDEIDGELRWPHLSEGARLQALAKVGKHPLTLDISSTQPLLLLSGKSGNTVGTIQSDLFKARFSGVANLATHGFLSGETELSTPDFSALVKWTGLDLPVAAQLKTLSLQARLVTNNDTLRFDNLSLDVNDVQATGILDLSFPAANRPRLTGTLAVGSIDFSPVFATLAPSMIEGGDEARLLRSGLELDLRLSASQAKLGPFQLEEVAIGLMNIGEQSRLDILDSDFEGGRLTGRVATIKEGPEGGVAVRLSVHDADFPNIIERLGLRGPLPAAPGSLEVSVDVASPSNLAAWRNAKGSVRFSARQGILPGVNLTAIRQLAGQKPYFSLSEAVAGAFEFESIDVTADLANGSADINQGRIVGPSETMLFTGVIPYVNNSLALSATIQSTTVQSNIGQSNIGQPTEGQPSGIPPPSPASVFFIGGSWPDPVIWPISPNAQKPLQ
ncbi:AsmA family protein [Rhizobium deserti]|uniref:AsmA family protein n=1 Tax=Rhizobium deserti TaxID=2547961 RepID=A0A4R5UGP3_9HYPH|nr:AsmA-like C-terminal region-containing protein [Rhizobium deserti]TDK35059.1 AsmA family protein [Rhizobium deserti]